MSFLLFFPACIAHARYGSRMIDRFLNWCDHGKPKSGKIKGRCQPSLRTSIGHQCCDQLTAVKTWYSLTSIT